MNQVKLPQIGSKNWKKIELKNEAVCEMNSKNFFFFIISSPYICSNKKKTKKNLEQ